MNPWHHLVFGMAALAMSVGSARAECKLSQMEIPVRIVDSRPVATLTINGTEVPMLVDSGAFYSMLSAATAAQLKLQSWRLPSGFQVEGYAGRIAVEQTRVEKLGLLGAELKNVYFLVGGNELGAGIMGILGRNILSAADTEYDLAHGMVKLTFPKGDCDKTDLAYWAGKAPVVIAPLEDLRRGDTAIRIKVRVNNTEVAALLDTGAASTTLTLSAARRAGIAERELTPIGRVGGAGEGRVNAWAGQVALFEVGGEKIANNRLVIASADGTDQGVLIGLDYFLSHRIYVSRLQRQLYITWNGGPVFAQGRAAQGEYDAKYAALPQAVSKDDAGVLARRGAAALAAKDYPRALEDLNRACELAPTVADHFYTRARAHLAMRQNGLALADLDETLRLDPALAEARMRRVRMREELGQRPLANADLAQLDATLPPSSHLRAAMARLYSTFSMAPEALRQFELWLSTHPQDLQRAGMLNARCWMRTRLNMELPLALQDCKDAVDEDDGSAAYHDSLGWTYLRLNDAARAKRAFDEAIKLQALPFSLYGRGLAQLRLKNAAGGEQDLAAARKLGPKIDEEVRKEGFDGVEPKADRPS